jgi:uncharacterized phage protein gp47/JayE
LFENRTYEALLNETKALIPSNIDKQEGSLVHTSIAPFSYKLAEAYNALDNYIDLFNADTATGDYLDKKAFDYGIKRKSATFAVKKVVTTSAVGIGTRWSLKDTTYIITDQVSLNVYSAKCEQSGQIGNIYTGSLEPLDNIVGITATLTDIISDGEEEENDDMLRERIKQSIFSPAQDANNAQYKKWAMEYPGIGTAKVFPLWNGGNTVKIAITNRKNLPAESALVIDFQNYIDPGIKGLGNGVAPCGSKVTVTGGTKKDINVSAKIILATGYLLAEGAEEAISNYLASIVYEKNVVSYMRIGSALLDCKSIVDISNLTVNNSISDISLNGDEIPVLVNLNITVVAA